MTAIDSETTAVDQAAPTPPPPNRLRRKLLTLARVLLTVIVAAAVIYTTVSQWGGVKAYLRGLSWQAVALSLVLVLVGTFAGTLGWRRALAEVGHRIPVRSASQIYLIGLLAKYVPGSVWAFVLQMELGKRANLPRSRPFLASLVLTGLTATVALVMGLTVVPALFDIGDALAITLLALVPIALVCAHPRVLTFLVQRFLKIVRRPTLDTPITWRGVVAVAAWGALAYLCFGGHLWLLANAESGPGVSGFIRCVGAVALGLTVGMLAFLAPSGLGVREAIIVAALAPYVSTPGAALGMALVSRMVFTVGDLLAAGVAALAGIRAARSVPDSAPVA